MGGPWAAHGPPHAQPIGGPWAAPCTAHGPPVGGPWVAHGPPHARPMGRPWAAHGPPHAQPMGGRPWDAYGPACAWAAHGSPMWAAHAALGPPGPLGPHFSGKTFFRQCFFSGNHMFPDFQAPEMTVLDPGTHLNGSGAKFWSGLASSDLKFVHCGQFWTIFGTKSGT